MRYPATLVALLVVLAGCGDDDAATTIEPPGTTVTTGALTTTTPVVSGPPAILAIVSGRGDDGTLEVAIWFDSEPLGPGATLIVGIDSDDSYNGVGDVRPHLEGFALFTPNGATVDVTVSSDGEVVADRGSSGEWVSFGSDAEVLRVFFVQDVAVRGGTVWVLARLGDDSSPLGTAGVPLGDACSHVGSGVPVVEPAGGIPDAGRTCLYK